jgi:hypothetical protein
MHSSGGVAGLVTVDGDLAGDLAVSGGHHEVRRPDGPPLVAVVRPADVRLAAGLLSTGEVEGGLPTTPQGKIPSASQGVGGGCS